MIIKRLFEEYDIDIDKVILRDYKKMNLKYVEATMLLVLLSSYKKRKVFSISMLSKKTELKKEKVEEITYSLIEKGFMKLELEVSNEGKEREIFNLDQTFTILENFMHETNDTQDLSLCGKTIVHLENLLGRILTETELNHLRAMYEEKVYTHEEIIKAINIAEEKNKLNIKAVDKILLASRNDSRVEIDEKTRKTLDDIYKSIK